MRLSEEGLDLSKAELDALLAFASQSAERLSLYGVQFRAVADGVHARAANSVMALEGVGENEHGTDGEWLVHRDFLVAAKKLMDKKSVLRLPFENQSLREALILDEDAVSTRSTLSWPDDAIITQTSFPEDVISPAMEAIDKTKALATVTLNAHYLSELKRVAQAAGTEAIHCSPPAFDGGPSVFVVCGNTNTAWRVVIMPLQVEATVDGRQVTIDGELVDEDPLGALEE